MAAIQNSSRRRSWFSQRTKEIMTERNLARDNAKTSHEKEDWENYKKLKNQCTKEAQE